MTEPFDLIILPSADVTSLLDVDAAIESQRRAFLALGEGRTHLGPKASLPGEEGSRALSYFARIGADGPAVGKFLSVNPANPARGLALIHGVITVLDAETGRPAAVLDGTAVTTLRTAAGSAVAVDTLARQDAATLTIVGSGVQALSHGHALARVRGLDRVLIAARRLDAAEAVADDLRGDGPAVEASDDIEGAVREADVVVLCTTSMTPVIDAAWVRPGATVVSIGSFAPDRHEAGQDLLGLDVVAVDDVHTNVEHAGPVMQALEAGTLAEGDLVALGAILAGHRPGRTDEDQTVFYNSVGLGVQDAAAAETVLERARATGAGLRVTL
ncbi:MAG: ornithine cyclodeaminase family protein [Micrococcales bacterium]|nr:ornithine cyclodeaminase family protein [Micrococcales bacterium]